MVTLAQIVFELEKKNNFMPLEVLRGLIRDGHVGTLRAANDSNEALSASSELTESKAVGEHAD